jgi:hypothetical protein
MIGEMGPMLRRNFLAVDAQDIRKLPSEIERDHEILDLRRRLAGEKRRNRTARVKSKTR